MLFSQNPISGTVEAYTDDGEYIGIISTMGDDIGDDDDDIESDGTKTTDGGPGSGNFGHEGRPGEVGGSGEGGGSSEKTGKCESINKKLSQNWNSGYSKSYNAFETALKDAPVGSKVTFTSEDGEEYTAKKLSDSEWEFDDGKADIDEVAGIAAYYEGTPAPKFTSPDGESNEEEKASAYSGPMAKTHDQIDNAQSTDEVTKALRDSGIFSSSARTSLRGADPEVAKEIAHASVEMIEQYPWMKKKIKRMTVETLDANTSAQYVIPGGYDGGNEIHLSRAEVKKRKTNSVLTNRQFHPIGTGSNGSTFKHEFGHAVTYTLAKKRGINPDSFADAIRSRALSAAGLRDDKVVIERALSRYANTSAHEFIAESFAEYHSSPSPRPLCRAVVEEIKKEARIK